MPPKARASDKKQEFDRAFQGVRKLLKSYAARGCAEVVGKIESCEELKARHPEARPT